MATDASASPEGAVLHDLLSRVSNTEAIVATLNIESNRHATIVGNIQNDATRQRDSHTAIHQSMVELNAKVETLTKMVANSRGGGGGPMTDLVDWRTVKIETFDGTPNGIAFRQWA